MINTLYQEKSGKFQRKKAVLTVQAIVEGKGMKKIGSVGLNISDYYSSPLNNQAFPLENCPDKNSRIWVSIRGQALGDATIADNMSEASGVTGFSMGTEGDYSANLFHEQNLEDIEEGNASGPQIIPGRDGKPPMIRGPLMKFPDSGPVNPMKISEAMGNQRQKLEEEMNSTKITELKASLQLLEKENLQIKSEKDDLKVQLSISLEKSKKERENYSEHMKKLDTDIDSLKKKNETLRDRVQRREEKIEKLKKDNDSMLNDIKELEKSSFGTSEEKGHLRTENDQLKAKISEQDQKIQNLNKHIDSLREEKKSLENSLQQSQNTISQLKADFELLRHDFTESRETVPSKGQDGDAVFENYKKKTEVLINNYKKDIKTLEHEREEALSKQTEMTFELQKAKSEAGAIEERYRQQLLKFEKEHQGIKEENSEIKQKLEDELNSRRIIERKSSVEKNDFDNKLSRMNQTFQEMKAKKESLEQTLAEYERQFHKKQSEYENDSANNKKLMEKCEKLEQKVKKYKDEVSAKNKELEGIYATKESLEQENFTLREHLKTATTTEFSDPANIILQEQVESLTNRVKQNEQNYQKEKSSLNEKIRILENQVSILEKKKKETLDNYEQTVHKLTVENSMLKDRVKENKDSAQHKHISSTDLIAEMQKESNNEAIQLMKIDISELKSKLTEIQDENKALEKKYVDAKMGWANADLEKENVMQRYRDAQEQLREYSSQYTVMEVEMYKINERFGQTLNQNNELEMEVNNLRIQVEELKNTKKKKLFR